MNFFQKKTKSSLGFTMLEVIAVLVVLGIIAAVAVSRLAISGNELYTERDILQSNLRFTEFKALTNDDSTTTSWGIKFAGGTYILQRNGFDSTSSFFSDSSNTHALSGGVTITAPAADTSVTYDLWGTPVDSTGTPLTTDITVTLAQGEATISFTITRTTGFIP